MNEQKIVDAKVAAPAVRAQLAKILESPGFVRSNRMQRFLEFVVEETLAGRADQLGEYNIGTAVFDRGSDFEPALDPIVRNDARRLRVKLLEYYRQAASGDAAVLIDMPKGGYVPVFRSQASRRPLPIRVDDRDSKTSARRRLAVLPFDVLSTTPETAMYGRALCMSLTAKLTNLDGLEAVAHGFLAEQPIREAACELNLSHIIHGTVLKSSDRCRVIVNLIHASEGTQMWAREYDFHADEMFAIQSQISASVLNEVSSHFGLHHAQPGRLALVA